MKTTTKKITLFLGTFLLLMMTSALAQDIRIDGSSTVYPISLAVAEEFQIDNPDARVTVAFSGTGGGFKKFCVGETEISDASRVVKQSEIDECQANGVNFIELPVAIDALTVAVNKSNDFVDCLTTDELKMMFEPDSGVTTWQDVRADWPAEPIEFYIPGADSGTFDYFTEAINGESGATRSDVFPSEDDNVLVQGIEGNQYAVGYFGYAYYVENQDRIKAVGIDSGNGCVVPSEEAVVNGTYSPLSRPLFIYVNADKIDGDQTLADFVNYYLSADARPFITDTGYITFGDDVYTAIEERFANRTTGSAFQNFQPGDDVLETVRQAETQ